MKPEVTDYTSITLNLVIFDALGRGTPAANHPIFFVGYLRMELERLPYRISTDLSEFQLLPMHQLHTQQELSHQPLCLERFDLALKNSLCFGLFHHKEQVGMARVVTDYASFAHITDLLYLPEHEGQLEWLLSAVTQHPLLCDLPRWHLVTVRHHAHYFRAGFRSLDYPRFHMERLVRLADGQGEEE